MAASSKLRVLVTGGAGYIGSILVPDLLARGCEVTVVDNLMYRQTSLAICAMNPNFHFHEGDVRDFALIRELIAQNDVVIPLAALVGAPACDKDPIAAHSINSDSVLRLFEMLSPDQRVVMPTTNSAYGTGAPGHVFDEESPLQPISLYASDKVKIEEALLSHPNAISFRLATVFGASPRMRLDLLVNDFVRRAYFEGVILVFEGHFKRNYVHIRDVSRVLSSAAVTPEDFSQVVYNVGLSSANLSKLELCDEISRHIPNLVVVEGSGRKDPDQRNYIVSNARIEGTGHGPRVSLEDGIGELLKIMPMYANRHFRNV